MSNITVLNVSHNKREPDMYFANNPEGLGPDIYLFIHFITPATVVICGEKHITGKNACIIYSPRQRQEYGHHLGVYTSDFLIFKVDEPHFVARYGLPENAIFYVADGDKITRQTEIITYTITDKLVDRSEETLQNTLALFETLSDLYVESKPNLKRMFEIRQRFTALRDEIIQDPRGWTVSQMATRAWFTRCRFSVIYNELFGISPSADLISIRIEHAKQLLESTDKSIADISTLCGYSSVEHFIRIFNQRVRSTPLQYRKGRKSRG